MAIRKVEQALLGVAVIELRGCTWRRATQVGVVQAKAKRRGFLRFLFSKRLTYSRRGGKMRGFVQDTP